MIDSYRTFGTFEIYCDNKDCERSKLYDTDGDWDDFIREAYSDGWESSKADGRWTHICPDCVDANSDSLERPW